MGIDTLVTYHISCTRCNKAIEETNERPAHSKYQEISISDGGDRDVSHYFNVRIQHQVGYGCTYENSVLCDECRLEALVKAIQRSYYNERRRFSYE